MIERRGKLPSNNVIREHKFLALHKGQEQMSEQPISKEEAERLAQEFLRRPANHFYDEHYWPDNPALHIVVKYALEFARMLKRRGFDSIACYYDKNGWSCAAWCGKEQLTFAESFFLYQTVAEVARRLDESVGQHYVCCAECQEPLLKASRQIPVPMAREDGMGMPYLTGETRVMEVPEYRSAKVGPHSPTLVVVCPGCGTALNAKTVKEIADV